MRWVLRTREFTWEALETSTAAICCSSRSSTAPTTPTHRWTESTSRPSTSPTASSTASLSSTTVLKMYCAWEEITTPPNIPTLLRCTDILRYVHAALFQQNQSSLWQPSSKKRSLLLYGTEQREHYSKILFLWCMKETRFLLQQVCFIDIFFQSLSFVPVVLTQDITTFCPKMWCFQSKITRL